VARRIFSVPLAIVDDGDIVEELAQWLRVEEESAPREQIGLEEIDAFVVGERLILEDEVTDGQNEARPGNQEPDDE